MTTMMAPSTIELRFPGNLTNANKKIVDELGGFLNLPFNSSRNTNKLNNERRLSSLVTASYHGSPGKVGKINGMKKNTIHGEAPLTTSKLSNNATRKDLVTFLRGRFVEDKLVYRQVFVIRSYEVGPDKTITMETLMNFLQETALNQASSSGVSGDDFGVTREMDIRKLIWVITRMQAQVQRYSKWGDKIEVDTWLYAAGKTGMRRDWIIRDNSTKEIIARATSTWAFMNKETRRSSKIPKEVRQELDPFLFDGLSIASEEINYKKIHKLTDNAAERIRSGMAPRWNDLDVNKHVNNVKYIKWILESMPTEVLQDYNMTSMTLEFRRECTQSNLVESMTSPLSTVIGDSNNDAIDRKSDLQYTHLLRLQDNKAELVRARTVWRLKQKHN